MLLPSGTTIRRQLVIIQVKLVPFERNLNIMSLGFRVSMPVILLSMAPVVDADPLFRRRRTEVIILLSSRSPLPRKAMFRCSPKT